MQRLGLSGFASHYFMKHFFIVLPGSEIIANMIQSGWLVHRTMSSGWIKHSTESVQHS